MRLLKALALALPLLCGAFIAFADETEKQLWTCGMHPQVLLNHPGNCPICHMKLTPVKKDAAAGSGAVTVSPEARQAAGLVSSPVVRGAVGRSIRAVGIVAFDETSLADVTTKYRGWVEKLHVDFTGREVHKGEPLLELYSPDVFNAQAEYLIARKSKDARLIESAKMKLGLLDIPEAAIVEAMKSGAPSRTLPIPAPRDGVVVEKDVVQGQMVEPGARLYRIADLGTVWVVAQIYEKDLRFVKLGQRAVVETPSFPERRYHGAVAYIYPSIDEATRTAKARIELHNPGYALKPGMFANVSLTGIDSGDGLLVPAEAVLRGGGMDMVFVDLGAGRYEPRAVKLGPRAGADRYQILDGVKEGDLVVSSGQFLLDSEANLRAAFRRLNPSAAKAMDSQAEAIPTEPTEYVCPMPEHMSVTYKEPGKCKLCGMALVPCDGIDNSQKLDHYTCPMHPEVVSDKPGRCPKCAMTLIPVYKKAKPDAAAPESYTCPMHPEVVSDKAGRCPKCGMDLVPASKK